MDIVFQSHHAVISDRMRLRAERLIEKISKRHPRLTGAVVRFEQDGPTRRVEVVLHVPRRKDLIAEARARNYGPALAEAVGKLTRQLDRSRRSPKSRGRRSPSGA